MYSILILLICVAPSTLAVGCAPCNLPGVVVFGDSNSDTGNVYTLTSHAWPIVPPYYNGRYCNGPNWVDDLAVSQKLDLAYGSATTDSSFVQGYAILPSSYPVPGVLQQVAQYLSGNPVSLASSVPCYLHVVWAGANDFIFNPAATPQQVITSLSNSLGALLGNGVKNLLVFNQPPAQYTPTYVGTAKAPLAALLVQAANGLLNAALTQLKQAYPTASIYMFDTNSLITQVLSNSIIPSTFTNNNTACWINYNLTAVLQNCPDPTKNVFVDIYHFSSPVHALIAQNVQPFFSSDCAQNSNLGQFIISYNNAQGD